MPRKLVAVKITLRTMAVFACWLLLAACFSDPPPRPKPQDETKQAWYPKTVARLASMDREADADFRDGKSDDAAALVEKGEDLSAKLLAVPRPTLEAMQSASDLDDLYARMLYSNRNYGWARLLFQKNLARWKHWLPQTSDTESRIKQAQEGINLCDRSIEQ